MANTGVTYRNPTIGVLQRTPGDIAFDPDSGQYVVYTGQTNRLGGAINILANQQQIANAPVAEIRSAINTAAQGLGFGTGGPLRNPQGTSIQNTIDLIRRSQQMLADRGIGSVMTPEQIIGIGNAGSTEFQRLVSQGNYAQDTFDPTPFLNSLLSLPVSAQTSASSLQTGLLAETAPTMISGQTNPQYRQLSSTTNSMNQTSTPTGVSNANLPSWVYDPAMSAVMQRIEDAKSASVLNNFLTQSRG